MIALLGARLLTGSRKLSCYFRSILNAFLFASVIGLGSAPLVASAAKPAYPVIFIHGINSSSETWADLRDRLIKEKGWKFGGSPKFDGLIFAYTLDFVGTYTISLLDVANGNCPSPNSAETVCKLNKPASLNPGDFYTQSIPVQG